MDNQRRYQLAKKVTLIGALFNTMLAILKMIVGVIGHSSALFADGLHSLSDLLTDGLVIVAAKFGAEDADESHPYGHRRIETAATVFLSLLLTIVGVAIIYDGIYELLSLQYQAIKPMVIIIALISTLVNEGLYLYTMRVGKQINSKLIMANAWHHRSDAISSVIVLVGVVASICGYHYFDAIAACLVGLLVIKMGWSLGFDSAMELIDSSVDSCVVAQMRAIIEKTSGVVTLHQLRTRSMAGHILVDVHIIVDEKISVSEGHQIAQTVALKLRHFVKDISDVTVHVDCEDDEVKSPCVDLPTRDELLSSLNKTWKNMTGFSLINHVILHYLDGKITIDCYFNQGDVDVKGFQSIVKHYAFIRKLHCYQELF